MYEPAPFRNDRITAQHALIRAAPLGLLVSAGAGGLMANPIPFLLDAESGPHGTLRAHLARPNPQWRDLAGQGDCLVVFQGPERYVTPSWYTTKRETGAVVPTWNYTLVQARGRPRVIEDEEWLRRQIDDLTRMQEAPRDAPWAVSDAPPTFTSAMIRGIVGIEIPIAQLSGKWKVSQNRPEADRAGVAAGLRRDGADAMADLVEGSGPA